VAEATRDFVTRDLSLASYLQSQGLPLRRAGRNEMTGDFEFVLEDPKADSERLKVEWANSCCVRHEASVMRLKALLRSGKNGNGSRT